MKSLIFISLLFILKSCAPEELSAIRNLRAHYDPGTDTITVDWEWRESEGKQLEGEKVKVICNTNICKIMSFLCATKCQVMGAMNGVV